MVPNTNCEHQPRLVTNKPHFNRATYMCGRFKSLGAPLVALAIQSKGIIRAQQAHPQLNIPSFQTPH